MLGCPATLAAQAPARAPDVYSYAISYPLYGAIGTHDRTLESIGGATCAHSRIQVVVRILGVVVHRETADQFEVWRGQRLESFQSLTTTNGRPVMVSGVTDGDRFLVSPRAPGGGGGRPVTQGGSSWRADGR